jgi:tetratricopeptide (TPR) repeat protein
MSIPTRTISTLIFLLIMLARLPGQHTLNDADMAIMKKNYGEALRICDSIRESGNLTPALDLRFGTIYAALSDYTKALEYLLAAEAAGEKSVSSGLLIASCHETIGDLDAASEKYEEIIYADRTNIFPVISYSTMLLSNRLFDKALKWCQLLVDTIPDNPLFRKNLGGCFLQLSMDGEALHHLNESWKLNSKDLSLITAMTTAWLRYRTPGAGLATVSEAMRLHPLSPVPPKCAGNLYFALQKYDSAAISYHQAYNLGDTSLYIARQLGLSYYGDNKFDQAIPFLTINYKSDTTDFESNQYLGLSLAFSSRQREAIPYLEQAAKLLLPDSSLVGNIHGAIGKAAGDINNYSKGIDAYREALKFLPGEPDFVLETARLYDQSQNYREALKYYEMYLEHQNGLIKQIAEAKQIDPEKISLGSKYDFARYRIKKIREELFFMGEIKKINS